MLRSLIAFCLSRRLLVMVAFAAFLGLGFVAFLTLNIEAYPDPAPPIIEIIAQQQGQSPEEVERYITIPIEIAVASTPGLKFIRSNTVYGLGFIRLQFEYGRDYHFVRQQTINRLKDAVLPAGVLPVISPAGGISEIFRYELVGPPGMDVMQLKTLQDWVVERKLRIVPGVADVAVLGGKTKEFQAEINLDRMMAYGLTLPQIMTAISASNSNVGGRTIAIGEQSVNVRSIGVISSMDDIGNIVLTQQGGVPVLVSDVAKVQIGFAPRLGLAGRDDKTDVVTGIVLMQKLERTMDVVKRVRAAVERINTDGSLPSGVKIVPFYDRGDLVAITVQTVLHNLLFGIALIFLIQWVFLGDLRCALIVAATIPVALFLAVIITVMRGESANLLSVGAIDLGIIVDGTVIMVENIFRHIAHHTPGATADRPARLSDKLHRILTGAVEVDKAIFFSVIITIAAFLPLFTMQGVEGQIFGPMARTYAYALLGAVIATFTVTPVLASILLPAHVQEVETFLVRHIRNALPGRPGARGPQLSPRRGCRRGVSRAVPQPVVPARHRVPAQAGRGQSLDPRRDAADHHARGRDGDGGQDPRHHLELSAGPDRVFRAGPRRRRHRSRRLVPRRVLRAAQAGRHLAVGTDQGADGQADEREAQPRIRRRRFQLLAIHPGQYRGSRLRRERRELDQDLRQGPQRAGTAVQIGEDRTLGRPRRRRPRQFQSARPAQSDRPDRSRQDRALRLLDQRHQFRGPGRDRRPGSFQGL